MATNGIQRNGFSCVADALRPLSVSICDSRLSEMEAFSQNSIGLHAKAKARAPILFVTHRLLEQNPRESYRFL